MESASRNWFQWTPSCKGTRWQEGKIRWERDKDWSGPSFIMASVPQSCILCLSWAAWCSGTPDSLRTCSFCRVLLPTWSPRSFSSSRCLYQVFRSPSSSSIPSLDSSLEVCSSKSFTWWFTKIFSFLFRAPPSSGSWGPSPCSQQRKRDGDWELLGRFLRAKYGRGQSCFHQNSVSQI